MTLKDKAKTIWYYQDCNRYLEEVGQHNANHSIKSKKIVLLADAEAELELEQMKTKSANLTIADQHKALETLDLKIQQLKNKLKDSYELQNSLINEGEKLQKQVEAAKINKRLQTTKKLP